MLETEALAEFCRGKKVLELGVGPNTLILSRQAAELTCITRDKSALHVMQEALRRVPDKSCEPELVLSEPPERPLKDTYEVLVVNGFIDPVTPWLKSVFHSIRPRGVLIFCGARSILRTSTLLDTIPRWLKWLDSIQLSYKDTSLTVITKRKSEVSYK